MDLETSVRPRINGQEPQAVIDEQLDGRFDVFIGIFWKKFGTPTEKYGSGTEQEFYNAWNKHQEDSESMEILFYFCKRLPKTSDELDGEQFTKVMNFKKEISRRGFFKEYDSFDNFEKMVKNDLRNFVLEKKSTSSYEDEIDKRIEDFATQLADRISRS